MNAQRSWLEGPQVPGENEDLRNPSSYAGERLGLPKEGPGSLAGLFPRMAALLIDWCICWAMAGLLVVPLTSALGDVATATYLLFIVWRTIMVWFFAQTVGHAVVGIGVGRVDERLQRVGFPRSLGRALLTALLFPPIIQDTDGRGLHDRLTRTAVIRSR